MIISHKHKFIFFHIPKCAGSSIVGALGKYYGLTSMEKLRNTDLNDFAVFKVERRYGNADYLQQHSTYNEVKEYFDKNNLNIKNYFKFSFMRNPWERATSYYSYACKRAPISNAKWCNEITSMSFSEFIAKYTDLQLNRVCNKKNNVAVDFLGSGKNLQKDFDTVCDKIGIPQQQLPHKNKTKHKHYTEYYDDETREIVAKNYARDIEYFGYEFGD
jgi:hypothetical protein